MHVATDLQMTFFTVYPLIN